MIDIKSLRVSKGDVKIVWVAGRDLVRAPMKSSLCYSVTSDCANKPTYSFSTDKHRLIKLDG